MTRLFGAGIGVASKIASLGVRARRSAASAACAERLAVSAERLAATPAIPAKTRAITETASAATPRKVVTGTAYNRRVACPVSLHPAPLIASLGQALPG